MTTGPIEVLTSPIHGDGEQCGQPGCAAPAVYTVFTYTKPDRTATCSQHHLNFVDSLLHLTNASGSKRVVEKAFLQAVKPPSAQDAADQLLAAVEPGDLWLIVELLSATLAANPSQFYMHALDIRTGAAAERLDRIDQPAAAAALRAALTSMGKPWRDDHAETDIVQDLQAVANAAREASEIVNTHLGPA